MAALPDRYGKTMDNPNHVVTNNLVVTLGIIVGACGVAIMGTTIVVKTGEFHNFAGYALEMLKQTQFVLYVGYGALILGLAGLFTGFLISMSGLFVSKMPKLIWFSMFCLLVCAAGNLAGGALIQQGMGLLNDAIYSTNTTVVIGSFTQNVTHFQLAMFNACCGSKGLDYSEEKFEVPGIPETKDLDGTVKFCDSLHVANQEDIRTKGFRACFHDQETYRQFNYSVGLNAVRICATLSEAQVNVAGKKVPGTSVDVTTALTGGDPIVPLVGPKEKPDYGCGAGYAKAFQAAMLIWVENIIQPVGTAMIACGALYIVLLVLTAVTFYSCTRSGESAEERYERYMEEIQNSSGTTKPAQVSDAFEQSNPNRLSMQPGGIPPINSNRMSVQSYATHGSHSSSAYTNQPQAQEVDFNVDDKI